MLFGLYLMLYTYSDTGVSVSMERLRNFESLPACKVEAEALYKAANRDRSAISYRGSWRKLNGVRYACIPVKSSD